MAMADPGGVPRGASGDRLEPDRDGGAAQFRRHLSFQLVHRRRRVVDDRDRHRWRAAVVPAWIGPSRDFRLLHAQRRRHVVHAAGARVVLLLDPEGAEPPDLFLRAGRARVLDQPVVLPVAGRTPLPVQSVAVVAADHRDRVLGRDAGAGVGGQRELPADDARPLPRADRILPAGVPVRRRDLLPGRLDPGHRRSVPLATGKNPGRLGMAVHLWLALVGVSIYVIALSIGGTVQGLDWVHKVPFIQSVVDMQPYYLWRGVGGILMFLS